jgi:hypothetical protein
MSYDEKLAARIREVLADRHDVIEKKMFGGLCFMVADKMCCGLTKSDFMVRVGPDQHAAALEELHARPMDFTGRPMKGMVYVAPAGLRTRASLEKWVNRGLAFVAANGASAPRPAGARSKRR